MGINPVRSMEEEEAAVVLNAGSGCSGTGTSVMLCESLSYQPKRILLLTSPVRQLNRRKFCNIGFVSVSVCCCGGGDQRVKDGLYAPSLRL